tara:strand:+ start:427 stop:885 length:459 start_codon:yes stop_codon:yes gene_type:complete
MQTEPAQKGFKMENRTPRPQSVDLHVASQVKRRRMLMGLSQKDLGASLGLSFQQVQKYESGANRITAGRLYNISEILEVQIDYFFEALYEPLEESEKAVPRHRKTISDSEKDRKVTDHTIDFFDSYYSISDPDVRKTVLALTKQLGNYFSYR